MSIRPDFKVTAPLSGKELEARPIVMQLLQNAKTKLTNADIARHIRQEKSDLNLSSARIRKIMNHIRVNKLVKNILADSQGYYVSNDIKEVRKYVASLDDRIHAITTLKESFDL